MKPILALCLLLVLCLLPQMGGNANETPVLLAYYAFDTAEDLGRDYSGLGHGLTAIGNVTSSAGYRGGAAYFDGASGLVAALEGNDFLDLYDGESLTVSFFAKVDVDRAHKGNLRIVDHGVNGCEEAFTTVLKKNESENGAVSLTFIGTAGGSDWWGAATDVTENPSDWHRYTLVYDADHDAVTTYVDGVKRAECYSDGNAISASWIFTIGGCFARADWFQSDRPLEGFIGAVDEVKIIGGVMPDAEDIDAMVAAPITSENVIRVDFSNRTGIPLFKRQNTFSPSHSFTGAYIAEFIRDSAALAEMRAESMRVDLFMGNGGIGSMLGRGTPDMMRNSFMQLDMTLREFYEGGVLPYVVYFATPEALFDKEAGPNNFWKYPPKDDDAWAELCGEIAEHYAKKSWPLAAHEIWNEPDWNTAFYLGTWEDYLRIYEYAVTGIRQKSPYAMVGGLSLATFSDYYVNGNVRQFLDHVKDKALPLDFISYHCYEPKNYPMYTQLANTALSAYGDDFCTTGLHLNEFHISMDSKVTSTEACVGPMMDAILFTLDNPTITSVNWACFRVSGEEGIQMINSRSGKRFAAYHLLSFYNRMPIQRVELHEQNQIRGIASLDDHQAGVMLYNRTYKPRDYALKLENLPFSRVDITIYAIDETHSNYGRNGGSDEASVIYRGKDVVVSDWFFSGVLPTNGLIYVEIVAHGNAADMRCVSTIDSSDRVLQGGIATVLRREYFFEDRSSTMFSEFDLRTFTAWAGMGNRDKGTSRGGVVMENLPSELILYPTLSREAANEAVIAVTAEYIENDHIIRSMIWQRGGGEETLPMGEKIYLDIPEGFDGQLRLAWRITDAGRDVTLKIDVDKE